MLSRFASSLGILNALTSVWAMMVVLCAWALLASGGALAQPVAAPPPSAEEMAATEIAVLEFVGGGSPLTQEERQQAIDASALATRLQPAAWIKDTTVWRSALQRIASGNRVYEGDLRGRTRYAVQNSAQTGQGGSPGLEPVAAIENRIVLAHDPVVVFDRQRKLIVTEHTLQVLRQAAVWMAENAALPGPGPDFPDQARQWIRTGYASVGDKTAQALAAIERDLPAALGSLREMDPQQREATMRSVRAVYEAASPAERDLKVAEEAALMALLDYERIVRAEQAAEYRMMEETMMGQLTRRSMYWGQRAVQSGTQGCTVTTPDTHQLQTSHCNP